MSEQIKKCNACNRILPISQFAEKMDGTLYKCCNRCIANSKRPQAENPQPRQRKKKDLLEKTIAECEKQGISYKEMQIRETLKRAGMTRRREE